MGYVIVIAALVLLVAACIKELTKGPCAGCKGREGGCASCSSCASVSDKKCDPRTRAILDKIKKPARRME